MISPVSKHRKPNKKKKKSQNKRDIDQAMNSVNYICLVCNETEKIPLTIVRDFDSMDDGDPTVPPQFSCESCGGPMYPEYYKGIHGIEYKISDVL